MSAFATSQLPTNINTLERLGAWVGLTMANINPTLAVNEQSSTDPTKVCQVAFFRASDNSLRLTVRLSLPIDSTYAAQTKKFWENAQEISNVVIPTAFTTN